MTGCDHEYSEQITLAAAWLASNWSTVEQPVTRALRQRFGLDFNDAAKAIAEAKRLREGQ